MLMVKKGTINSPCLVCLPVSGAQTGACSTPSAPGGATHRSSEGKDSVRKISWRTLKKREHPQKEQFI